MSFMVNEHSYKYSYFLCDGIYRDYSIFMKAYSVPRIENAKMFTKRQESTRSDIERTFGVIKHKWHVVKYVKWLWDIDRIERMRNMCIIMHNMIIKNKGRSICAYDPDDVVIPFEKFILGTTIFLAWVVDIHNSEIWVLKNRREDVDEHLYQQIRIKISSMFWILCLFVCLYFK